jgi:hypothetical protein
MRVTARRSRDASWSSAALSLREVGVAEVDDLVN